MEAITAGPLSEAQAERFREEGYLIFPGFFDPTECASLKADIDRLTDLRQRREKTPFLCEFPHLGPLISHPRIMEIAGAVLGPGFAFHHLHAVRQDAGTPGVCWHQDYEQIPQTNRSHVMVHFFYYLNGLNGTVGDLLFIPRTWKRVVGNGDLCFLGTIDLPNMVTVNDLPPGSAVLVHSGLWHARRAQPGGEETPRYFADASYCQAGIRWPSYGIREWRDLLRTARERGLDRDGQYAHLFDESHFFDRAAGSETFKQQQGSLAIRLPEWREPTDG
ncbi:MAG: phytanoyl-CoA dioxygenase family protein [Capsulimonadales bacterium]|nr:phytanoyl-CoA dioxygenase family protein [Capsulimonadales bacterium]